MFHPLVHFTSGKLDLISLVTGSADIKLVLFKIFQVLTDRAYLRPSDAKNCSNRDAAELYATDPGAYFLKAREQANAPSLSSNLLGDEITEDTGGEYLMESIRMKCAGVKDVIDSNTVRTIVSEFLEELE